ncbi:MAG TPA: hypothetical protein VHY33_13250 [Thermoanaerobaculia bacterium]|nr:hypothetical protein [Thermoanaerobaculia bacterium]
MLKTLALLLSLAPAPAALAQTAPKAIKFDSLLWNVEPGAIVSGMSTDVLALRGEVHLKDVAIGDGIVEVDIMPTSTIAFVGVVFRAESSDNFELVYARPFKSDAPDALQYTPRFNRVDAWQIYSGPGYNAAASFSKMEPAHLKVVFDGHTAAVFVNRSEKPSLIVPRLQRAYKAGSVGLWGAGDARFSNFTYQPLPRTQEPNAPAEAKVANTPQCWAISQNVEPASVAGDVIAAFPKLTWENVRGLPNGLLEISRFRVHRGVSPDFRKTVDDAIVARTYVTSAAHQIKRLDLAYSDRVTLFINGKPVFRGNATLGSRDPSFLGTLALGFDAVYAELQPGRNEIMAALTENNWGWGVQLRFADGKDIELSDDCGK